MLPLLLLMPASGQENVPPALQAMRGRKIWMVGAPPADCARVERELGLVVECDTTWETRQDEVVIWCTEIPHEVGPAILSFLGRSHAEVRTHQTNPSAGGTGECGQIFEITVRYPSSSGSEGDITAGPVGGDQGSKKLFGSTGNYSSVEQPTLTPAASGSGVLAAMRGRKIWMINAPQSECDRVERELGLVVECDPAWEALAHEEIVIWCTDIPHEAAPAILGFLGKDHYRVRTHQTNPSAGGTGECGEIFEITVRY